MAYELITRSIGLYRSAQDLTANTGYAVQLNGLNEEVLWQLATNSGDAIGVLLDNPTVLMPANVCISGIAPARISDSSDEFLAGEALGVGPDGTLSSGGGFAIAVEPGGPGDIISVLLGTLAATTGITHEVITRDTTILPGTAVDLYLVNQPVTLTLPAVLAKDEVTVKNISNGTVKVRANTGGVESLIDGRQVKALQVKYAAIHMVYERDLSQYFIV